MVDCGQYSLSDSQAGATGRTDAFGVVDAVNGHRWTTMTEDEFLALHDRYIESLFGHIAARLGRELAEDITAETFAAAWAGRANYDPTKGAFSSWLFGIATHLIARHARTESRRWRAYDRLEPSSPAAVDEDAIADEIDALERFPLVTEALAKMRQRDRDIILLFAWENMSYAEIADALDIPVGTVRSRLARARGKLDTAAHRPPPAAKGLAYE